MHGLLRKVVRLGADLTIPPSDIGLYVVVRRTRAFEMDVPWFRYSATDFLDGHARARSSGFEWGSEEATSLWDAGAGAVISVESEAGWNERSQSTCTKRELVEKVDAHLVPNTLAEEGALFLSDYCPGLSVQQQVF